MGGSALPHEAEVGVLGVEHSDDGFADLHVGGGGAGGGVLPEEVAQLLGGVWMSMCYVEDDVDGRRGYLLARVFELSLYVLGEGLRLDHVELDLLGAAPEWLVLVVKDALHHVALAPEVEVRHLGLLLKDGAHQAREVCVDVNDLLELIQDQHDLAFALAGQLTWQFQQPLQRGVDVRRSLTGVEAEAQRAVLWIDGDRGTDAQALKDP